jgi:NDP-sugar pyrophosphorylase family protein
MYPQKRLRTAVVERSGSLWQAREEIIAMPRSAYEIDAVDVHSSCNDVNEARLEAIVLCGGRGTRLAAVLQDVPKPLAPVLGRPFLDYVIAALSAGHVVSRVIVTIHHLADQFIEYYENHPPPLPIKFVREPSPLNTGGAIYNALPSTAGESVFCLNGDTLVGGDLSALLHSHRQHSPGVTIGLVRVPDTSRFGHVDLSHDGHVLAFTEKGSSDGEGLINAGIYVIDRAALGHWSGAPVSFETEILPSLAAAGRLYGLLLSGPFIDIGVPETYAEAEAFVRNIKQSPAAQNGPAFPRVS